MLHLRESREGGAGEDCDSRHTVQKKYGSRSESSKRMKKTLTGCVRKEAGRPPDQRGDVMINVEGLTSWEKGELAGKQLKTRVQEHHRTFITKQPSCLQQ